METRSSLDRRAFLGAAALAGGSLLAPRAAAARAAWSQRKTQRVILVAMAGGVRSRETIGTPANVPSLMGLAEEGVLYTRARSANLGHFGAALSIFTGISEARGIRENARGGDPTLFEYVRKDLDLAAGDVWISTSGGVQQTNYAYGLHPDYGAAYGANTLDGDGIFNSELQSILKAYGRPKPLPQAEEAVLARLRGAIGRGVEGAGAGLALNSPESAARVERYILDELSAGTADIRGANAADAKALRVARNLVSVFRPKLIGVALQQADVAHGSFNAYVEVLRQNDAALGELVAAVKADPDLAESTAIVVLPEFGRDRDLNSRRGLDHGDGSDDINYVAAVCWGPDFRRGQVVQEDVQVIDVCPTVCELLGARARFARGKPLPRLYA